MYYLVIGRRLLNWLLELLCEELLCDANEDDIIVEGVLHKIRNFIIRHMFSIASEDQWQNHVRSWLELLDLLKLRVTQMMSWRPLIQVSVIITVVHQLLQHALSTRLLIVWMPKLWMGRLMGLQGPLI